jgi:hypothetical protein
VPPINFKVSQPRVVSEQFRAIILQASSESNGIVPKAARYMLDELAYDPLRFGESREYREAAGLQVRVAFCLPLHVWFAVHEDSKQVFIIRVGISRTATSN